MSFSSFRSANAAFACVLLALVAPLAGCGEVSQAASPGSPEADSGMVSTSDAGDAARPPDASRDAASQDAPFEAAAPDAPSPCSGKPGTFHNQSIQSGGETRYFFLYVPSTYSCSTPSPMLVDFHGTCDDKFGPPEECYELPAAIDTAEKQGFILVRPRSRFANESGTNIYRWDENPGDIPLNVAFTQDLLPVIESQYAVDAARVYAMGFSSGTNMASQFLGVGQTAFHGI